VCSCLIEDTTRVMSSAKISLGAGFRARCSRSLLRLWRSNTAPTRKNTHSSALRSGWRSMRAALLLILLAAIVGAFIPIRTVCKTHAVQALSAGGKRTSRYLLLPCCTAAIAHVYWKQLMYKPLIVLFQSFSTLGRP
jgi:hypothetical protein